MVLKKIAKRFIPAIGRLPVISTILQFPSVRGQIEKMPGSHLLYPIGWDRIHPFDLVYGTDTSGVGSAKDLPVNEAARAHAIGYAGSQPSVLRLSLAELPPLDTYTFLDLGCGKGRTLLVASEFSFRDIVGVELSPPLAGIARRNAAIIAKHFPRRTPVRVVVGDASAFPLPAGDLVIFLYNPFGAEIVAKVVAAVEAAIAAASRSIYIVYYNPVAGHCFDRSPLLYRCFARMLPYGADELGYGPDRDDPVVIWQGGTAPSTATGAVNAKILVSGGTRVTIES
jgi:SAM-dependent methyltransferase